MSLNRKSVIIITTIALILAIFVGAFMALLSKEKSNKINASPEKVMFDRLEALYRNKNYIETKQVLQEINAKYPNSDIVKKANSTFINLDELIKQNEVEKAEQEVKAQKAAEEHRQYLKQQEEAKKKQQEEREKTVYIGDNQEKVLRVMGKPDRVNRTVTKNSIHEQWVYGRTYIYLDNGVVTSWQDSK